MSNLGPILDEYKLLTEQPGRYSSWGKTGNKIRYQINTGFGWQTIPALGEYYQNYRQYQAVESEIAKLKKSLTEARAKELWESA